MEIRFKFFLVTGIVLTTLFPSLFAQDFRNPPDLQVSIQPGIAYRAGSIGEHLFNRSGRGYLK